MSDPVAEVWDGRSVLFKSFWGWSPDTWAALGWSTPGRRSTLCEQLTNPFILACSVTRSAPDAEEYERGKLMGFYLVSHESGDRDEFTHPIHFSLEPEKWRYALRCIRAFDYLPEYRLDVDDFDSTLARRALNVAANGEIVTDARRLALLRDTPWEETVIYRPGARLSADPLAAGGTGMVRAGPENAGGYFVPVMAPGLARQLYILRLDGQADALLGTPANGRHIIKIGLAVSPESRRSQFQRALPRCAFAWKVHRTSWQAGPAECWTFQAAECGEYAMKRHLAVHAEHLGGEFYLASDGQIEEAWRLGIAAAQAFGQNGAKQ